MDPNLRTLSLAAWMSLPGLDFNTWEERRKRNGAINSTCCSGGEQDKSTKRRALSENSCSANGGAHPNIASAVVKQCKPLHQNDVPKIHAKNQSERKSVDIEATLQPDNRTVSTQIVAGQLPRRILSVKRQPSREVQTRALVSQVAEYYEDYVREMDLERYFCNDTLVTSVRPIHGVADSARWLVSGVRANGRPFVYACKDVVLSNGASDLANRLGLRGENIGASWIKHDLPKLESALEQISDTERSSKFHSKATILSFAHATRPLPADMKPVLIVGAGLSAADAVTICRSSGISVIHVYRNRSAGLDKMLPETVYPEYHEVSAAPAPCRPPETDARVSLQVHKMMKDCSNSYPLYTPLPEHKIIEFSLDGEANRVVVQHLHTHEIRTLEVSFCAILIGFRPDLRFLSPVIRPSANRADPSNELNNNADDIENNQSAEVTCEHLNRIISNADCHTNMLTESSYNGSIDQHLSQSPQQWSMLSKKILWLKNLCAKCRHLNLCEWSRRTDSPKKAGIGLSTSGNHIVCTCSTNNNNIVQKNNNLNRSQSILSQIVAKETAINDCLTAVGLGEDPSRPIDCKSNPILVDKFTNEVIRSPKGLYAMGPLVGDNFIRFIPGGALAITSALHKEND